MGDSHGAMPCRMASHVAAPSLHRGGDNPVLQGVSPAKGRALTKRTALAGHGGTEFNGARGYPHLVKLQAGQMWHPS